MNTPRFFIQHQGVEVRDCHYWCHLDRIILFLFPDIFMIPTPRAEDDIQMPYGCTNGRDFPCVCPCCFKGQDTFCSSLNLHWHYPGCGPLSSHRQQRWSSSIPAWPLLIQVKGNFWKRIDPLEFCWSRLVSSAMLPCCYRMRLCWCLLPAFTILLGHYLLWHHLCGLWYIKKFYKSTIRAGFQYPLLVFLYLLNSFFYICLIVNVQNLVSCFAGGLGKGPSTSPSLTHFFI